MLPKLSTNWTVARAKQWGTSADVTRFFQRCSETPNDYRHLAEGLTEYDLVHSSGQYFRIWAASNGLEMDDAYHISSRIPGAIPIGDDGGDRAIVYADGMNGRGLYRVGFGALDAEELLYIAPNLEAVLTRDEGILEGDVW